MSDSLIIRRAFDIALTEGQAYGNLRDLCKNVGHRLSGSPQADMAIQWGFNVLQKVGADTVYKQKIEVPFWKRGENEYVKIKGIAQPLRMITLGGSVATPDSKPLKAEVIEVTSLKEISEMDPSKVKGKIVFYNRPMDARNISTFEAYSGCVDQRYWGAVEAARAGAVGVLVRSMTLLEDDEFPHTGSMGYDPNVKKIPSVALATQDANLLHKQLMLKKKMEVEMLVNAQTLESKPSFNVIAEIRGYEHPEKIIVVGGHLDSWDVGEGAHDDGAGIVHSIEALRILTRLNYRPRHTIRVVLFMNEENGNMGGKSYAKIAAEKKENHIAAIESDRGGFSPRGFSVDGSADHLRLVQSFDKILKPYGLHYFESGHGGVDIGPLKDSANKVNPDLMLMGLIPDSQRYFDFHHCADDVFENVNKRELELGCASMAAMMYLLDRNLN